MQDGQLDNATAIGWYNQGTAKLQVELSMSGQVRVMIGVTDMYVVCMCVCTWLSSVYVRM